MFRLVYFDQYLACGAVWTHSKSHFWRLKWTCNDFVWLAWQGRYSMVLMEFKGNCVPLIVWISYFWAYYCISFAFLTFLANTDQYFFNVLTFLAKTSSQSASVLTGFTVTTFLRLFPILKTFQTFQNLGKKSSLHGQVVPHCTGCLFACGAISCKTVKENYGKSPPPLFVQQTSFWKGFYWSKKKYNIETSQRWCHPPILHYFDNDFHIFCHLLYF